MRGVRVKVRVRVRVRMRVSVRETWRRMRLKDVEDTSLRRGVEM